MVDRIERCEIVKIGYKTSDGEEFMDFNNALNQQRILNFEKFMVSFVK